MTSSETKGILHGRPIPLIMAHGGGSGHKRENSLEAIKRSLESKVDIIEVDVHKSRDGMLYCHHGSGLWGVIAAAFFGLFTFAQIQKIVGQRDTLKTILESIPGDTLVYLDIKDFWISEKDLRPLMSGREGVYIMPFGDFVWLKRLVDSGKVTFLKD